MKTVPPDPNQTLLTLQKALADLRQLAELPSADPLYLHAAEQVAAIVAGLESRASPGARVSADLVNGLYLDPPSPRVMARPAPNHPEPSSPG